MEGGQHAGSRTHRKQFLASKPSTETFSERGANGGRRHSIVLGWSLQQHRGSSWLGAEPGTAASARQQELAQGSVHAQIILLI